MKNTAFYFVGGLLLTSLFSAQAKHYEARVVFDIGSGTTKMKVYRIEKNTKRTSFETLTNNGNILTLDQNVELISKNFKPIQENVPCLEASVNYSKDLGIHKTFFSDKIISQGVLALQYMKACALSGLHLLSSQNRGDYYDITYVGVATSAFRSLKKENPQEAQKWIKTVFDRTAIPVSIIDNKVEGLLGAVAAATAKNLPFKNLIVWDIGGGSWQMNFIDPEAKVEIFSQDGRASQEFLKSVLEATAKTTNPNPITLDDIFNIRPIVVTWAREEAALNVAKKMSQTQNPKVLAIGNVHGKAILPQINSMVLHNKVENNTSYTLDQLRTLIDTYVKNRWNSKEPYSESTVTNAILVEGYMHAWNIPAVDVADANLTEGLSRNPNITAWNDYLGVTEAKPATKIDRYKDN